MTSRGVVQQGDAVGQFGLSITLRRLFLFAKLPLI
jgi:hypothetical protein